MRYFKLLIFVFVIFFLTKICFLHPTFSDENFYFNVAKQVTKGDKLYKDFFFAHPPLQIYALAFLFTIFGPSFFVGKILSLILTMLSATLVYLILCELYNEKVGFAATLVFMITPQFLSFSSMGYGLWETMTLVLFSFYLLVKDKPKIAGIIFAIGIFFRYIALPYLVILLFFSYLKRKNGRTFFLWFISATIIFVLVIIFSFGYSFIFQTILYHVSSKIATPLVENKMQYWNIGYFFLFLSFISALIAFERKDKILLTLSLMPLGIDLVILFTFKIIYYHYFLISLAFFSMAIGRALIINKESVVKFFISIILILSILSNIQTIEFYLNPNYAQKYYSMTKYVNNKTFINDSIFGEPVATNYISFVTDRRISSNYLDSYLRHLVFEGEEKVIEKLKKDKPKIIIEAENYYLSNPVFKDFILKNYKLEKVFEGFPKYSIYALR